ncbi:MAG: hypothetical protein BWZ05_01857 [Bacteroidetes bacterium ADurb.BinA245]|jgi:putative transposase|nr:MAG: hypothetical protein BWZ05_01857 [Bacteroidetes bacterium ADurb.BinA245]
MDKSKKLTMGKFSWQEGYGAFFYSKTHVERVIRYIKNQKQHHEKISFTEEYLDMLRKFGVDFKEAYIFKSVDYK